MKAKRPPGDPLNVADRHQHLLPGPPCAAVEPSELKDLGLFQLCVRSAAYLVAADMALSGDVDCVALPEDIASIYDARIEPLLAPATAGLALQLLHDIDTGTLRTSRLRRKISDGTVDEVETFVSYDGLVEWLEARGHRPGDWIGEWLDEELEVFEAAVEHVKFLRAATKMQRHIGSEPRKGHPYSPDKTIDALDGDEVRAAYKALVVDHQTLRAEVDQLRRSVAGSEAPDARPEPHLHPRRRRTMLAIIGALCHKARIPPHERGASQRIKELLEHAGTPIDDETIRGVLTDVPEAVADLHG